MKAAIRINYGPPDVISIKETEKPVPGDREVLVRVRATTVNRTDCGIATGKPYIIRLFTGFSRPKLPITGTDFAGEVESVGNAVQDFSPGDRVWGFDDNGLASHAQYLTIREDKGIATIPDGISFDQVAASPEGAHYAYNFINKVNMKAGHKVMVNGATGAIGSAAVQILKYFGAYVTATANTKNMELVKSLGADRVIDYTREDFTQDNEKYDYVFDSVGKSAFGKCKPLLNRRGVYISSELGPGGENTYLPLITAISGGKRVKFPFPVNIRGSIYFIRDLLEKGKFRPVIDRNFAPEEISEAFRYVASGQKTGNVIIRWD